MNTAADNSNSNINTDMDMDMDMDSRRKFYDFKIKNGRYYGDPET
jgi:hypothetical protein